MCIYCTTTNYRKIYENHVGPIPYDEEGRKYHIHHIDGNRKNNQPDNLLAVSIIDHLIIHESQGDWAACLRLSSMLKTKPDQHAEYARQNQLNRVSKNIHVWQDKEKQSQEQKRRVTNGTHNWLGGEIQRSNAIKRINDGTHNFLDSEQARQRQLKLVESGNHRFLGGEIQRNSNLKRRANGTDPSQVQRTCPHCGRVGLGSGMIRWHFDRCKSLKA